MGINRQILARFYIPKVLAVSSILFCIYSFGFLICKQIVDDTLDDIKADGLTLFRDESDLLNQYMGSVLDITGMHVTLAYNLIEKYNKDHSILKIGVDKNGLVNGVHLEEDPDDFIFDDECQCNKNYTEWYTNYKIEDIDKIDLKSKEFLNQAKLVQTVFQASINSNDDTYSNIFKEMHLGFKSNLVMIYPAVNRTIFTDYDCTKTSDTCKDIGKCYGYVLECRYWYSISMKVHSNELVLLKPYNRPVKENIEPVQKACMKLPGKTKTEIIGVACMGYITNNLLVNSFESIFEVVNGMSISFFVSDTDGYIIYHPNISLFKDSDLINVTVTDMLFYNESGQEKDDFQDDYNIGLEKLKNSNVYEFTYIQNKEKQIMRLINSEDRDGNLLGIIGFHIEYGVIDRRATIIEQEINDFLNLGVYFCVIMIVLFITSFSFLSYGGILYFTYAIDQCSYEINQIKSGIKLKYEVKPLSQSKEITILNEVFQRLAIIYVLDNDQNLTEIEQTIAIYEEAFEIFHKLCNHKGTYAVGYHLGMLYMQNQNFKFAIMAFENCIKLAKSNFIETDSLGRVLACLLQAYYMVENSDSIQLLFRNFDDVLSENDIKTQLLLECDYIEFNGLPLRDYLAVVKQNIDPETDNILHQKYYYYKTLMYFHQKIYPKALKTIEKSLKSGKVFDPQLRMLILKKLKEILSEFDISWGWIDKYLKSLKDEPVDLIILSALSIHKSSFYFELMRRIYPFSKSEDTVTHFICNSAEALLDEHPKKYSKRKFSSLPESCLHKGWKAAIDFMRDRRKIKENSNFWIVILNDKPFTAEQFDVENVNAVSKELGISYGIISNTSIEAFQKLADKSVRSITYEEFDSDFIERMLKFIFCMRYEINTFISERFLYATYLV